MLLNGLYFGEVCLLGNEHAATLKILNCRFFIHLFLDAMFDKYDVVEENKPLIVEHVYKHSGFSRAILASVKTANGSVFSENRFIVSGWTGIN
jgi:hypothetical protein